MKWFLTVTWLVSVFGAVDVDLMYVKYEADVILTSRKYDVNAYLNERWCQCAVEHTYCNMNNHNCYADEKYTGDPSSQCAGRCTVDYGDSVMRNGINENAVITALMETGVALKNALEAVNMTKAYKYWLEHEAQSDKYISQVAETIKSFSFDAVDKQRMVREENLSAKVAAVSALSSKLASEEYGGTPEEQEDLTNLLDTVEKDRAVLSNYDLNLKLREMVRVEKEFREREKKRPRELREAAVQKRQAFLRAARRAQRVLQQWDFDHERKYEEDYDRQERFFDTQEDIVERVTDGTGEKIDALYARIKKAVQQRISLLNSVANADVPSQPVFETIYM